MRTCPDCLPAAMAALRSALDPDRSKALRGCVAAGIALDALSPLVWRQAAVCTNPARGSDATEMMPLDESAETS